jgi:hypothetical protein
MHGESGPYSITWNGSTGTLVRRSFNLREERDFSLSYLYSQAGPAGYASHLAWFLAKSGDTFSIVWCYLNDKGSSFFCWIYDYSSNQITSYDFQGSYQFDPSRLAAGPVLAKSPLQPPLKYSGGNFNFADWTRQAGTLPALTAHDGTKSFQLGKLDVSPLVEVNVNPANGWRSQGWQELHAIASDAAGHAYYLILYSNTRHGYAIDLDDAKLFTVDYPTDVTFTSAIGSMPVGQGNTVQLPRPRVGLYHPYIVDLNATTSGGNPYVDLSLSAELERPDGSYIVVPGYWRGGTRWRLAISPNMTGTWKWTTHSAHAALNGESGEFRCVSPASSNPGNVTADSAGMARYAFTDGSSFLPVAVPLNVCSFVASSPVSSGTGSSSESPVPTSLMAFEETKQQIKLLAKMGFNRLVNNWVIDMPAFAAHTEVNEGGAPFVNFDPDRINPEFFHYLDRRIELCTEDHIVPDVGIGVLSNQLLSTFTDEQIERLWSYILARYSSMNICWNILDTSDASVANSARGVQLIANLLALTKKQDPDGHIVTRVLPGGGAPAQPIVISSGTNAPSTESAYIQSPAGMELWPSTAASQLAAQKAIVLAQSAPKLQDVLPLTTITVATQDLMTILASAPLNKPITVLDPTQSLTVSSARHRLWQAITNGGTYVALSPALWGSDIASSPTALQVAIAGQILNSMDYSRLAPHNDLIKTSSSDSIWVLSNPGFNYLVYFKQGGTVDLDLLEATGTLHVEWISPETGDIASQEVLNGGMVHHFSAPSSADWVLTIRRN